MSIRPGDDQLGLYVHIPFCVRKCPYCDFNTFDVERTAIRTFLAALQDELALIRSEFNPPPVDTVFIGGGTPTVLSGSQLSEIMGWIHDAIGISPHAEVTVEANPGSVTVNGLQAMVRAGVNRLSLGVQSFSDEMLQRIGRNHTVRDVLTSYDHVRDAGIHNVNFDLMFALPGQTKADWERTLSHALELAPEHLSCYSLIIEEGTPFADLRSQGKLPLPPEDDEASMYERTIEACRGAGYEHYEISNFAQPGYQCRHNLLYWRNAQWLAAGPGAHGTWNGRRYHNEKGLHAYEQRIGRGELPIAGSDALCIDDQMDETIMLGLRLLEGISLAEFSRRFGCELLDVYGHTVEQLSTWGLTQLHEGTLRLTPRGLMMGNRVAAEFLRSLRGESDG